MMKYECNYEWSESGLELLRRIAGIILKNGGNYEYAFAIEKEWMNPYLLERANTNHRIYQKRKWSQTEMQFLQARMHLNYDDIAIQMKDRTPDSVRQKIFRMQKNGVIGSKWIAKRNYHGTT